MPQLHLYLPEDAAERIKERARAEGRSVSAYLAELVLREMGAGWPERYFEEVVGGWAGELVRAPQGDPESRDDL